MSDRAKNENESRTKRTVGGPTDHAEALYEILNAGGLNVC